MNSTFSSGKWVYVGIFILSCLLLLSGWRMGFADARQYLPASLKKAAEVQQGQLAQQVTGYGKLHSLNKRILTASSDALVDQILVNPGDLIKPGSLIMLLKNPALEETVAESLALLQNKKLSKRKALLEQQQEILTFESRLLEISSNAEIAKLQVEAQRPLMEQGIVSVLDFKRASLEASQLVKRENLEQTKLTKLLQVHKEHLQIFDEEISQAKARFDRAKSRLAALQVTSEIPGIVQSMDVKLGERVAVGDKLALVGSLSPLIAKIKVPQLQANTIHTGAKAEIDTRQGMIEGLVNRIDPIVKEGAVEVEIQLVGEQIETVRPLQLVEAVIWGESRGERMYVRQPENVMESGSTKVFKLTENNVARRIEVTFGMSSGGLIEVVSGLKAGDQIILSALQVNEDTHTVQFVQ